MKKTTFVSILFFILPLFSSHAVSAITMSELQNLVQCNNTHMKDYRHFSDDYEKNLEHLGWKPDHAAHQDPIEIYTHQNPFIVFERPTQKIAVFRNTLTAVYKDVNINDLSTDLEIPASPFLDNSSQFQGERLIHIEPATSDHLTYYTKLVLLEVEDLPETALLGCRYEVDKAEMEKLLRGLGAYLLFLSKNNTFQSFV